MINRTASRAEIDLLIKFSGITNEFWAIEIKKSTSANLSRGFMKPAKTLNPLKNL